MYVFIIFFFKQKTAYEMSVSDWSSDVCSSDLPAGRDAGYQILARLVDKPFVSSRWRTPQYRPAYRGVDMPDSGGAWFAVPPDTVRPRRPSFTGPVALLASPRTAGAAED